MTLPNSPAYAPALLAPDRLDIAVKWRYLKHLYEGGNPAAEFNYRRHIAQRTGGREPRSWKASMGDYLDACADLVERFERSGFDRDYPIEFGINGKLRDGAHRLAGALLFGTAVHFVTVERPGHATWGADWFQARGWSSEERRRLEGDWQCLKRLS